MHNGRLAVSEVMIAVFSGTVSLLASSETRAQFVRDSRVGSLRRRQPWCGQTIDSCSLVVHERCQSEDSTDQLDFQDVTLAQRLSLKKDQCKKYISMRDDRLGGRRHPAEQIPTPLKRPYRHLIPGSDAMTPMKGGRDTRRIPISACTGHVIGSSAERALDAGWSHDISSRLLRRAVARPRPPRSR